MEFFFKVQVLLSNVHEMDNLQLLKDCLHHPHRQHLHQYQQHKSERQNFSNLHIELLRSVISKKTSHIS